MKKILRNIKYLFYKNKGLFYPRLADGFYAFHQGKLRGSYEDIKKRQSIYIKYCKDVSKYKRDKFYFLDIGFGRGEFINLLNENKFKNVEGVDINKQYILKAKEKNYQVHFDDGLRHLYLSDKKYYGISAFHLIEHLEFSQLFDLLLICSKKIVKGGVMILETPNIENIKVGATTFNLDYTHKLKLPTLLLKTLLQYLGFSRIEVLYLHPAKKNIHYDIKKLMFVAQDLGVIAYK